jgi:integrase
MVAFDIFFGTKQRYTKSKGYNTMQSTCHLLLRPSGYYFRIVVPGDLRHLFRKRELKYSLKTSLKQLASSRAMVFAGLVKGLIINLRKGIQHKGIGDTINKFLMLALGKTPILSHMDHSFVPDEIVQEDILVAPSAPPHSPLMYQDFVPEPVEPAIPTLDDIIKQFFDEGDQTEDRWTSKTRLEMEASLEILKEILGGDIQVNKIDRLAMAEFKKTITMLPPNMNKDKRYKGKPIKDIIKMKPAKTISTVTINKNLGRSQQLFDYAMAHGYMSFNPAKGLKVKQKKRNDEARAIYTQPDLNKLFHSDSYLNDTFVKDYYFWSPVLALFTGARQTEIGQLYLDDFKKIDGVWCIDIIEDSEDKKVKTKSSKRIIPLHPFLVDDLGIINRVQNLKGHGEQRFLPDLQRATDGYGVYISKWFNDRYKRPCGITDINKNFHSFRHTFGTNLSHNGIDDHSLKARMGHSWSICQTEVCQKPICQTDRASGLRHA